MPQIDSSPPELAGAPSPDAAWLDQAHRLYRNEGLLVVRNFFDSQAIQESTAEVDELPARYQKLIHSKNLRCRFQPCVRSGELLFETFDPVIDLSSNLASLARHPRLMELLGALYGEPAYLFKDKLIFKLSGAKGYELHQDIIAWPDFPRSFCTVLIPFDAASEENGCTICYRGYHTNGLLSPEDGEFHSLDHEHFCSSRRWPLLLSPGDIAIFDGYTPHYSTPNLSPSSRRQLYLSYNAERDGGDLRHKHYESFHRWLKQRYANHGVSDVGFE